MEVKKFNEPKFSIGDVVKLVFTDEELQRYEWGNDFFIIKEIDNTDKYRRPPQYLLYWLDGAKFGNIYESSIRNLTLEEELEYNTLKYNL